MTWQIKIRGVADRPIAAEYQCPTHGRFGLTVDRDANGDAPEQQRCPHRLADLLMVGDEEFSVHAYLQMPEHTTHCGRPSPYVISAPRVAVRRVEVERGGWQKPERKTWLDTRNLGEGQDVDDFRADRERIRDDERRRSLKELLDG